MGSRRRIRRSAVAPAVSVSTCRAVSGNEDVLPGCIADVTVIVGLADADAGAMRVSAARAATRGQRGMT